MAGIRRLNKEFKDLVAQKTMDIETVDGNYYHWQVALQGPTETPYFGGTFLVEINFPNDYPFSPPKIHFSTMIYHPNIDMKGNICLGVLKDDWAPRVTVESVLSTIIGLLRSPNPDDPLMPDIAKLYSSDRQAYMEKAAEVTRKYAM